MARLPVIFKSFEGGWSTDQKVGLKNSFYNSQSVDFRTSPSQLSLLPQPTREDNGVVIDLIQNEVMVNDGTIYAVGDNGGFYKRTTAGVWAQEAKLSAGCFGINYRSDMDAVFIATTKSATLYQNVLGVNGSTSIAPDYYGQSYSTYNNSANVGFNVAAFQQGSSQTYTPPTSIFENITNQRFFQTDIEPLAKISVFINTKGTGDWTLTLHDGLNNTLGTKTITNTNLKNNQFNDFSFTAATNSQVRVYPAPNARTYHVHVTSTVADGTMSCSSSSNLSSCDLEVWADRFVYPRNGMHPWARFQQWEIIGNSNYVSIWEPITPIPTNSEWQRHKLTFPQEFEVCGIAVQNEFVAIATEQSSNSSTINQNGIIFFWDGLSETYNYYVKIPEGAPYGIHEYENVIYYYAGGSWYAIASPTTRPVKIRALPSSDTTYSGAAAPIKVYPYAATVRRGIHLMAYPSYTTNTTIPFGVYSWGSVDKNFPASFGHSFNISTGSTKYTASNNLAIGMVKNFGDTMHISWRDTTSGGYGVDVVNNASTPASTASWTSIVFDNGIPGKVKTGIFMRVFYAPLPAGATVTPFYTINQGTTYTGDTFSSTNLYFNHNNFCRLDIPEGDFYEIQVGINITATATTPQISSIELYFDDNRDEEPA